MKRLGVLDGVLRRFGLFLRLPRSSRRFRSAGIERVRRDHRTGDTGAGAGFGCPPEYESRRRRFRQPLVPRWLTPMVQYELCTTEPVTQVRGNRSNSCRSGGLAQSQQIQSLSDVQSASDGSVYGQGWLGPHHDALRCNELFRSGIAN